MTTKVIHKGSARTWKGPLENWKAHSEVIIGWCDGREVECWQCVGEWLSMPPKNPIFDTGSEYRLAKREPKPGEVWLMHKDLNQPAIYSPPLKGDIYGFFALDGSNAWKPDCAEVSVFSAPDLRTYYAREFLAENDLILSGSETSVESYAGSLVSVMEKYAQLENEK